MVTQQDDSGSLIRGRRDPLASVNGKGRTMIRWLLGIALVLVTLGGVGTAQADYYDGLRAADAGRHREALREWQAAAHAGDAKAMLALGRLYRQGLGAPQDYIRAHLWFNLAASRGEREAVTERDALAARMTPEQVATAQEHAAAWQPQVASAPAASAASQSAGPPPPHVIREAQELLAALGYEPDPPDALHRAAKAGNLKGLEAALAAGADVNARDAKGWTALMYTVDNGYVLLVEPLLQVKADPDVQAPDGATALFMAVAHGHLEIIPILMQAGADPMIEGPKGKTATDLAQVRYGDESAVEALKQETKQGIVPLVLGMTLDDLAFYRARLQRTPEAYADYLASYPSGRHLEEVHRLQTALSEPPRLLTVTSPAGTTARECAKCPEMVVVPAGRFLMGAELWYEPVHEVTIEYTFAVGKYEVTMAEWDACVAAGGCTNRLDEVYSEDKSLVDSSLLASVDIAQNPGIYPVHHVSWDDAQAYVRWLSRETGKPYRLLSEAEWEYAARAGTTTDYWWGNGVPLERTERPWAISGYFMRTRLRSPVGTFEPNPFGLFDMEGNMEEWVEDCWAPNYEGAPSDGSARTDEGWFSDTNCDLRMSRGMEFDTLVGVGYPRRQVSPLAGRYVEVRDVRRDKVGFRCARTLD